MSTLAFHARERWFEGGLAFFAVGALIALLTLGLMWLPQLRVIAAVALVQALLGVLVCALGLHEARPARWNALRMRLRAVGHRARQRLRSVERDPRGAGDRSNDLASAERMIAVRATDR